MLMEVRKRLSETEKAAMLEALAPLAERQAMLTRRAQALLASAGQDAPERRWYVLRVNPGFDKAVDNILEKAGIERWMARIEVVPARHGGRKGKRADSVFVPALPGYIFVNVLNAAQTWVSLLGVEGVVGVLGGADKPSPVSDKELLRIKVFVERDPDAIAVLTDALAAGDQVLIDTGPFKHFAGVVSDVMQSGRALIEAMIFGRSVSVELDLADISKL